LLPPKSATTPCRPKLGLFTVLAAGGPGLDHSAPGLQLALIGAEHVFNAGVERGTGARQFPVGFCAAFHAFFHANIPSKDSTKLIYYTFAKQNVRAFFLNLGFFDISNRRSWV
jgi:hypothetical protein